MGGNCAWEKVWEVIVLGGDFMGGNCLVGQLSRGKYLDTINHNTVFFNYYLS